jgi:hypothetical protein
MNGGSVSQLPENFQISIMQWTRTNNPLAAQIAIDDLRGTVEPIMARIEGTGRVVGGIAGAASVPALMDTGAGAPLALPVGVWSVDQLRTGGKEIWYGRRLDSYGGVAIKSVAGDGVVGNGGSLLYDIGPPIFAEMAAGRLVVRDPAALSPPAARGIVRGTNAGRVTFDGFEVRAVRDLSHLDEGTLRAMEELGFAARDVNGQPLQLHHLDQNPAGPLVEIPRPQHNIGNRVQHPFGNQAGAGLTAEQRAAFNEWRTGYWQERAREELARRGLQ